MIKVTNHTDRYMVNSHKLLGDSFDKAYERTLDEIPQSAPDKATAITTVISLIMIAFMFAATAYGQKTNGNPDTLMLFLGAVCILLTIFFVYKYFKDYAKYSNASGKPSAKISKRQEFFDLFGTLSEQMSTGDLLRKISPMIGKQENSSYKVALKSIVDIMTIKNNPTDIKCKLVTTFGDVFSQPKRRMYLAVEGENLIFYDADFSKPKGEIQFDMESLQSYGVFSKYPQRINSSGGGKISPDAIIVQIKDEKHDIYFEFQNEEYDNLKKIFSHKKELK